MLQPISFNVHGVGAWGAGFANWADLQTLLSGGVIEDHGTKAPKPEIIPPNERRRAPLPVKLAVESSWQACQQASLDPATLGCVFVSGLGDTQLTDYMCKVLAGDHKALSPTKFHNSVHNAAAGYWTISTGCMQAANSVAGYQHSVPLTLLESLLQAQAEQRPILMTFYDAPVSPVLQPLLQNQHSFAVSMVIAPVTLSGMPPAINAHPITACVSEPCQHWPEREYSGSLAECYQSNPVARVLPVLELLADKAALQMPLSEQTSLTLSTL